MDDDVTCYQLHAPALLYIGQQLMPAAHSMPHIQHLLPSPPPPSPHQKIRWTTAAMTSSVSSKSSEISPSAPVVLESPLSPKATLQLAACRHHIHYPTGGIQFGSPELAATNIGLVLRSSPHHHHKTKPSIPTAKPSQNYPNSLPNSPS